jgi:hypothetical protein
MKTIALAFVILALGLAVRAQQTETRDSKEHHAGMTDHGDQAMGFSHEKTTHHFRLYQDGGAIEVAANDPMDEDSRGMIRIHLSHVVKMFAAGDFNTPMFIHGTTPPGATKMAEMRDQIHYQYQETASGGSVRIHTANATALNAIHDFLRFQIQEHKTGDSSAIEKEAVANDVKLRFCRSACWPY